MSRLPGMFVDAKPARARLPGALGSASRDEPLAELVRQVVDHAQQLVRAEVALAREEIRTEAREAKASGIAMAVAGAIALSALTMFMVAVAAAFHMVWLAALIIGGILLSLGGTLALSGFRWLPKAPLGRTRVRLETDLLTLKERRGQ